MRSPPTPALSFLYVKAMNRLVDAYLALPGRTESGLSRDVFGYGDGLKALRAYDGSNSPPTTKAMIQVEAFVRVNLDDDEQESERIYRRTIAAVIAEGDYVQN